MDLGGGCLGGEAPPSKYYYEQTRKLPEAVVQVQLHFIHIWVMKRWKEQGE